MSPKEINTEPCRECGVVIRYKADLSRHAQLHRPDYAVTYVDLEDVLVPTLTEFIRMFKCPYDGCEYQNLQRSNLNTHIYTHTGEKPHACPDCVYRTADPGSLTRHRKTQHGYMPDPKRAKAKPQVVAKRHNAYLQSGNASTSSANPSIEPSVPMSYTTG
ncbi:hypothetical protein DXG01_004542 [Tephrocybe rancida]|nr:hypothetical protein DXG01_004542 [Tephrocybe rancida]